MGICPGASISHFGIIIIQKTIIKTNNKKLRKTEKSIIFLPPRKLSAHQPESFLLTNQRDVCSQKPGYGITNTGYGTTPIGCRGGSRSVC